MKSVNWLSWPRGVSCTMLSAYTQDMKLDYDAQGALLEWYYKKGVTSLFAMCHSTEQHMLTMNERLSLISFVRSYVNKARMALPIAASGTFSYEIEEMGREICQVYEHGADAAVMLTNRLDPENLGSDTFMRNGERLLDLIPEEVHLGLYECPEPYKRVMSNREMQWAVDTGRFLFLKDTCCDPVLIKERLAIVRGKNLKLFNANSQTLLASLWDGAYGYCSCMSNVYPDVYKWLIDHYTEYPKEAEHLQQILCIGAFTETSLSYPLIAKYILQKEGVPIQMNSRLALTKDFSAYDKHIMDQLYALIQFEKSRLPGGCL